MWKSKFPDAPLASRNIRKFLKDPSNETARSAFEIRVPGRNNRPETAIACGRLDTPPSNNAMIDTGQLDRRVVDCGILGDAMVRPRRYRRPDGSRGAPVPPLPTVGISALPPTEDALRSALNDIKKALKSGQKLALAPTVKVCKTPTGAIVTMPDRGAITKYASVDDLAWALARKRVR